MGISGSLRSRQKLKVKSRLYFLNKQLKSDGIFAVALFLNSILKKTTYLVSHLFSKEPEGKYFSFS